MPRIRVVPFVMMAVASLSIVSIAPAQEAAATPPLPTVPMEGFRVDIATGGGLTPLESAKAMKDKRGAYLYCYIDGASSPVTFRHDEPLAFAYRVDGSPGEVERIRKDTVKDSNKSSYRLEFLFVSNDGRRYGTGKFVPMDRELYGDVVTGVNPKKPKEVGLSRLLKSRGPLAPGEYALVWGFGDHDGMAWKAPYGGSAQCHPFTVSAFRIVAGAPITQAPPPPSATLPRTPAAPTSSTSDIERLRRAAQEGDATAQGNLGHLHFLGSGVLQDYVEAHKWLNIAAARLEGSDRKQWAELRDKVAALMTAVERAEAQRRAADWMETFQQRKP